MSSNEASLQQRYIRAKRILFNRMYSFLNDAQCQAVFTVRGPLLVIAGAGSGKTTVLVNRIAFLIRYGNAFFSETMPDGADEAYVESLEAAVADESVEGDALASLLDGCADHPCPPYAVMSITFTNKAANEMKERLAQKIGGAESVVSADEIWAGTFHSICMRLLRIFSAEAGLAPGFTVYDSDDSKKAISRIMKSMNLDEKAIAPKAALGAISRAKDVLMTPDDFEADAGGDYVRKTIAQIYREYQRVMREANVLDFDDIICRTVTLLRTSERARAYCDRKFRYICVDEYQDTNHAQFQLVSLLAEHSRNLMVVGDDDQSIYKFRGACIDNILNFDKEFSDATVIKLEKNYRSTGNILAAANAVIANNIGRRGKQLYTDSAEGDKIHIKRLENQGEEARYIINKIEEIRTKQKLVGKECPYRSFAILYRMNAQSNSIEQVFLKYSIPYRVIGGLRFYERKEIKDIIAYLCIINNWNDNLRLRRIINEPKRKIGETTVNAVEVLAGSEGVSMFEIMTRADQYPAIARHAQKLMEFTLLIAGLRKISESEPLSVLIQKTIDLTGYREMLLAGGEAERDRLENVEELVSNAVAFEQNSENPTLEAFLEEVALVSDIDSYDENADAVVLMTIHSAKGLEFPYVFLPGMEEGIFPGMQAAADPADMEEERRLAYVAITRARERLYISYARERMLYGRTQYNRPSRFIEEIPESVSDIEQQRKQQAEAKAASESGTRSRKQPVISKEFFKQADSAASINRTKSSGVSALNAGDRVQHRSFGEGVILSATVVGADVLYEIAFDDVGTKKLMATYARLKKL